MKIGLYSWTEHLSAATRWGLLVPVCFLIVLVSFGVALFAANIHISGIMQGCILGAGFIFAMDATVQIAPSAKTVVAVFLAVVTTTATVALYIVLSAGRPPWQFWILEFGLATATFFSMYMSFAKILASRSSRSRLR